MIVRRRQERPPKPPPREEEPARHWTGYEPEQERPLWSPSTEERMVLLVDALFPAWPRGRRGLVAAAHYREFARTLADIPLTTWAQLVEARAQGRPCPPRHRHLHRLLAPLMHRWAVRDKVRW